MCAHTFLPLCACAFALTAGTQCNHYECALTHLYVAPDLDRHGFHQKEAHSDDFDMEQLVDGEIAAAFTDAADATDEAAHPTASQPDPPAPAPARSRRGRAQPRNPTVHSDVFADMAMSLLQSCVSRDDLNKLVKHMNRVWRLLQQARQNRPLDRYNVLTPKSFALWFLHELPRGWTVTMHGCRLQLVPCVPGVSLDPVKRNDRFEVRHHTLGEKTVQLLLSFLTPEHVAAFSQDEPCDKLPPLRLLAANRSQSRVHRAFSRSAVPSAVPQSCPRPGLQ